jgi:hypothetical protein
MVIMGLDILLIIKEKKRKDVKSVYLSGGYPACKLDGQTGKHSRFIDELEPYIESEQDDDPLLQVN